MLAPLSHQLFLEISLLLFAVLKFLFFLVEVAGLPVILVAHPVTSDNIVYNVLVQCNNLG